MIAALSSSAMWYLTRGAGLISLVLLTATVVLGVLQVQRWASDGWPRLVVAGLHKNISLLVLVFLGLHIVTAVVDGYVPIHWISVVVPFTSSYRPLWLGFGALAVDLLIALVITSLLRTRIPLRVWRFVHWGAYACWPVALIHGLGTGSDGRVTWVLALCVACLVAVLAAAAWRLSSGWQTDPTRRAAGAVAMMVMTLVGTTWAMTGPTQVGWARRAGTPAATTAGATETTTGAASGGTTGGLAVPLTAKLSGTLTQTGSAGAAATVTVDGTLSGAQPGVLHIEIRGTGGSGGGIVMSSSSVTMGTTTQPDQYHGTIQTLNNTDLTLALTDAAGTPTSASVTLNISSSGAVTGTVAAPAAASASSGGQN